MERALQQAGNNRSELEKLLRHYAADSLRYHAACFLVENMRWHYATEKQQPLSPTLRQRLQQANSFYTNVAAGFSTGELASKELRTVLRWHGRKTRPLFGDTTLFPVPTEPEIYEDLQHVSAQFLIAHIDNAFRMRDSVAPLHRLPFDDFCRYVLPYRSYPYFAPRNGHQLHALFAPHLNVKAADEKVLRYNAYTAIRKLCGDKPTTASLGLYDFFFDNSGACEWTASYAADALRACGVPTVVEFNAAYRDFPRRHAHCVAMDSAGAWRRFTPEVNWLGELAYKSVSLNLMQWHFAVQKDSPFMRRRKGESVPAIFNTPHLRESTASMMEVHEVTLNAPKRMRNNIAYLYAFQHNSEGVAPVTWGYVNHDSSTARFPNVLYNILYFPACYVNGKPLFFANPFWIAKDTLRREGYCLHRLSELTAGSSTSEKLRMLLTRKFPRKPSMVDLAEMLVGGVFQGANKPDFSDSVALYAITSPPEPYIREVSVARPRAYRYYRFAAPAQHPHANIAMLNFISDKKFGYRNAHTPVPVAVLTPSDTLLLHRDKQKVMLLDAPWEQMARRPEYNGNMQSAPSAYRYITLRLDTPQVATAIRFAPKNADNGITPGNVYELMYWDGGWQSVGTKLAEYSYIEFTAPANKLYWLRNRTQGQEELPFVYRNGRQQFLYYDMLNTK